MKRITADDKCDDATTPRRRRYDTEAAAIILLSPHFVLAHEDRLAVDAVALVEQVGAQLLLLGVDEEERAAVGVHQVLRVHLPKSQPDTT